MLPGELPSAIGDGFTVSYSGTGGLTTNNYNCIQFDQSREDGLAGMDWYAVANYSGVLLIVEGILEGR